MSVNPTTFRFPFKHPDDVTDQGFRLMQQGILDLNQAIASLHSQVQTNATNVKNITQQVNASTTTIINNGPPVNVNQQAADYTLQQSDFGGLVVFSGTGPYALTLNPAVTQPFYTAVLNLSSDNVVASPVSPNLVNNLTDVTILPALWAFFFFDGVNWWALDLQIWPITKTAVTHEFLVSYDAATGLFVAAQPAIADLSDAANVVQTSRTISTTSPLAGGGDLSADRTLSVDVATSAAVGVVKPDNTTIAVDGSGTISAIGGGGSGTVTSVDLSMPAEFGVTGNPITTAGTLTVSKVNQNANYVWAGPTTGVPALPTFRAIVAGDIPTLPYVATLQTNGTPNGDQTLLNLKAGTNVTLTDDGVGGVTIDATGGGGSGTVTSVDMSVPTGFTISGNPITGAGTLALGLSNETANFVWCGPTSGGAAPPTFRALVAGDIPSLAYVPTARTITTTAPVTIDGGASADLSANRTIAVSDATSSTKGVVQPDNTTITISSGVISAVAGATPALVLITETVLTGTATNFSFSSIPSTYRDLIIRLDGRGDNGTTTIGVAVTLNSDSGSNYDRIEIQDNNTTISGTSGVGVAALFDASRIGLPGGTAVANYPGHIEITIFDYTGTTFYKSALARNAFISSTGSIGAAGLFQKIFSGWWRNTAAVNAVTLTASAGNFVIGSRCSLYGSH